MYTCMMTKKKKKKKKKRGGGYGEQRLEKNKTHATAHFDLSFSINGHQNIPDK